MTSQELYYESQLILNKNASNVNINLDVANFVWIYNREAKKWLSDYLNKVNSNSSSEDLSGLLNVNVLIPVDLNTKEYSTFTLPENFYSFVDSYSVAIKNNCEGIVSNFLQKPKDVRVLIDNSFSSPSFEYEESLCNIYAKKLQVFKREYEIKATYLSYYKAIEEIDIEGYQKIDGSWSTTINTDLDPYLQSMIIDRVVIEIMREFENTNGFKFSQERVNA